MQRPDLTRRSKFPSTAPSLCQIQSINGEKTQEAQKIETMGKAFLSANASATAEDFSSVYPYLAAFHFALQSRLPPFGPTPRRWRVEVSQAMGR